MSCSIPSVFLFSACFSVLFSSVIFIIGGCEKKTPKLLPFLALCLHSLPYLSLSLSSCSSLANSLSISLLPLSLSLFHTKKETKERDIERSIFHSPLSLSLIFFLCRYLSFSFNMYVCLSFFHSWKT